MSLTNSTRLTCQSSMVESRRREPWVEMDGSVGILMNGTAACPLEEERQHPRYVVVYRCLSKCSRYPWKMGNFFTASYSV